MNKRRFILVVAVFTLFFSCENKHFPVGIVLKKETLKRFGIKGDNWCITWLKDGSQITSMCDGNWLVPEYWKKGGYNYHNALYRIRGNANGFTAERIKNYPQFTTFGHGWYGYGIYSVNGNIYSLVSRTPGPDWSGPFEGIKMLKSPDNGESWFRINSEGEERYLKPWDKARSDSSKTEMFLYKESGITRDSLVAYPFSFCAFVQNGRDNSSAKDEYVYVYSPEGAYSNKLMLARVKKHEMELRHKWVYFSGWDGDTPHWTRDLSRRRAVQVFPEKNEKGEYFGWYSWLPCVVWNSGLGLYIMVNGGTYAGKGLTNSDTDYFDNWMHTKSGSLGFWYSENPYGPWTRFYYTDYWTVNDVRNRTYQPKLSPKWISEDGKKMILIWSDNMRNQEGKLHNGNYLWNQMEIEIITGRNGSAD